MLDSNWHNCAWIGIRFSAFHGAKRLACVYPCECGPGGIAERWREWTVKKRQRDTERVEVGGGGGRSGYKMGIRLVNRPRGHGNGSMSLWHPTGTKTPRYRSSYYPACTCQGIDNRPVFYQTAPAAPISLLDGWLLIVKFQCKSNRKKLPFPHFFFFPSPLIVSVFHSLTQRATTKAAYITVRRI